MTECEPQTHQGGLAPAMVAELGLIHRVPTEKPVATVSAPAKEPVLRPAHSARFANNRLNALRSLYKNAFKLLRPRLLGFKNRTVFNMPVLSLLKDLMVTSKRSLLRPIHSRNA